MFILDVFIVIIVLILILIISYLRTHKENIILCPKPVYGLVPVETKTKYRVRILLPTSSSGLVQDAKVYHALIPNSYIVQIDRNSPELHPEANVKVDINLYLESTIAPFNCFPAKQKWLMVNQEYFYNKYYDEVDVLIAKSKYAEALLLSYGKKIGSSTRIVYLGHTSLPYANISWDKDWNTLVHFAGKSGYKGTSDLIYVWQQNGGFRNINPNSKLIITCRGSCFSKITEQIKTLHIYPDRWEDPRTGLYIYSFIDDTQLEVFRSQAGAFICPSVVEGYGHYINEGTANASVVLTSDFPPMNELVPPNKLLIQPNKTLPSWEVFEITGYISLCLLDKYLDNSEACYVDPESLKQAIITYYQLSDTEKREIGYNNYQHYIMRQDEFRFNLISLLEA